MCVCVFFGPVKPEFGVIPSGQENHSRAEHLNFPGREFKVINFTEQYFFKRKNQRPVPLDLKKSCYTFLRDFGSHQKRKTGWK